MRVPTRRAFSLVELLVVIAIIAVLVSLLLPAVQKVRFAAARTRSTNNLKQLALGIHGFHDNQRYLPFNGTTVASNSNTDSGSWAYQILPYIEQRSIYDSQTGSLPPTWNAKVAIFCCPLRERPGFVSGTGAGSWTGGRDPINPGQTYTTPVGSPTTGKFTDVFGMVRGSWGFDSSLGGPPPSVATPPLLIVTNTPPPTMTWTLRNVGSVPVFADWQAYVPSAGSGPVTDYGINPYLNDQASGSVSAANSQRGPEQIADGSSNTILVGHIYVAKADYFATTPSGNALTSFFSGGTLGTSRNSLGDSSGNWLMDGAASTANQWGSPMSNGGLMAMADGTVRLFPYTSPLSNFLKPNDGNAVVLP